MRINPAFKITLIYCAIGFLWIYLSDRFLFLFFELKNENEQIIFQNIKGFFYVIITGYLLYVMMKSFYKKNDDRLLELEVKQQQLFAIQTLTKTGNWEYDIQQKKIIWSEITEQIFEVDASYKLSHDSILANHLEAV